MSTRALQGLLGVFAQLTQGIIGLSLLLVGHQAHFAVATSALAVSAFAVAMAVGRPVQGRALDALSPPLVLAFCGVMHVVAFLLVAGAAHAHWAAVFVACSLLAGLTLPPIATQQRAEWPGAGGVDPGVFAAIATLQTVSILLAPLLFSAVDAVASPTAAMLTVATVSGACTVLFAVVTRRRVALRTPHPRVAVRRYLLPLVLSALIGAVDGTITVAAPAVAIGAGHPGVAGALVATATFGTLLGALYAMSAAGRQVAARGLLIGAAVVEAGGALIVLMPGGLAVAFPGLLILGLGTTPAIAALGVLVARRAGGRAESFGWQSTALGLGVAGGSAVAGALVVAGAHLSALPALVAALTCAGIAGAAIPRPVPEPATSPT